MTTLQSTDAAILLAVIDELAFTPSIDSTYIQVGVNRGSVTLTGEVGTYPEKRQAEKAALRVRGVNSVAEQLMVRNVWVIASDAFLSHAANEALAGAVDVPAGRVTASVHHRHVTLTGSTPWQFQRSACERAVRGLYGIAGVRNDVTVRPTVTADGLHEAITAALMRSAQLEGEQIVISVQEGDVTLEGHVRTWAERHQAELAAWSAAGVTNVNNHISIGRR